MSRTVDERRPGIESRRQSDCFPEGKSVAAVIVALTAIAFILGFALGGWVF